jgi:hypothetical protein
MSLMTAQIIQPPNVTEDLLEALGVLSPLQYRQVVDFARFLAQQPIVAEPKDNGGQSHAAEKKWVDQISGSFKDDPEFEEVLRYGREYRESPYPDYGQPEAQ